MGNLSFPELSHRPWRLTRILSGPMTRSCGALPTCHNYLIICGRQLLCAYQLNGRLWFQNHCDTFFLLCEKFIRYQIWFYHIDNGAKWFRTSFDAFLEKKVRVFFKPVLNPYSTHSKPIPTHTIGVKTLGLCANLRFFKPVLNPYWTRTLPVPTRTFYMGLYSWKFSIFLLCLNDFRSP